ncbi:hypothetical protein G9464_04795 [Halostella sp. JP-L12]|uniref:hypothetical protein n=1 Tax=Halostella TaxID=1843185 RepID=UPI000EF825FE|nr:MULTISPECIES: hypothetical protein [Halostella]NHN46914.1 hypothetical protein [Halostella sp. JP-L12]
MTGDAIEGQILLVAGAKASVAAERLPALVEQVAAELSLAEYRERFECVHEDDDRAVFLADPDHWERLGEDLDLVDRERDAVRRAHEEQVRRIARREDRESEFESALEIRDPVVVGK